MEVSAASWGRCICCTRRAYPWTTASRKPLNSWEVQHCSILFHTVALLLLGSKSAKHCLIQTLSFHVFSRKKPKPKPWPALAITSDPFWDQLLDRSTMIHQFLGFFFTPGPHPETNPGCLVMPRPRDASSHSYEPKVLSRPGKKSGFLSRNILQKSAIHDLGTGDH